MITPADDSLTHGHDWRFGGELGIRLSVNERQHEVTYSATLAVGVPKEDCDDLLRGRLPESKRYVLIRRGFRDFAAHRFRRINGTTNLLPTFAQYALESTLRTLVLSEKRLRNAARSVLYSGHSVL